jgi:hypothetical protein
MTMVSVPAPSMRAPMAFRKQRQVDDLRLTRGVLEHGAPSASVAAIIRFSVPVTVTCP